MKHFSLSFLGFVLLAGSLYVSRLDASPEASPARVSKATPVRSKAIPLTLETIEPKVVPETRTRLHEETERETDLLARLSSDKALKEQVTLESVNCENDHCYVIARKNGAIEDSVLQQELREFTQFGSLVKAETLVDANDKPLVRFTYSREAQFASVSK